MASSDRQGRTPSGARPSAPAQGPSNPLAPYLPAGFVILDGGLATELEARGLDLSGGLWSARWLYEDPDLIAAVHREYLEAGADCITAASYQATVPGLMGLGLDETEAESLLVSSVRLARQVRDDFWSQANRRQGRRRPLVAASIGPYGAFRADGSEYTGAYDLDEEGLVEFHRRRWQLLASAGADLLACETIPSQAEGRALLRVLRAAPAWAWFSFCCRDGSRLADGSPLVDSLAPLAQEPWVVAVGVNCTPPGLVASLIAEARRVTAQPVVVYPNSGERYLAATGGWSPGPGEVRLAEHGVHWYEAGATLIGGCCRTRPGDIRELRSRLEEAVLASGGAATVVPGAP